MKQFLSKPHHVFILLALLFGLALLLILPYGSGNDEETHLARIYEMSLDARYLVPNIYLGSNGLPVSFRQVSYRQKTFLDPVTWDDILQAFQLTSVGETNIPYRTRATYSPANYLVQAVLMAIMGSKNLNLPLPIIYYVLRFSYLVIYALCGYWAIRLIPFGKWVLFAAALAPMPILQASWISADSVANGVSFLFIGWVCFLIVNETPLNWNHIVFTLFLLLWVYSIKLNYLPLILLLLWIKPRQFPKRWVFYCFWSVALILMVVMVYKWNSIAWNSDSVRRGLQGSGPLSSFQTIFNDPFAFLVNFASYIFASLGPTLQGWVGIYGYDYWQIPPILYLLLPLMVLCSIIADINAPKFPQRLRLGLLVTFLALFLATFGLRYLLGESLEHTVMSHGRYFTAVFPLLFLSLTGWKTSLRFPKFMVLPVASLSTLILCILLAGTYISYYQVCGSNRLTGKACVLPIYKNWNPLKETSQVLKQGDEIDQTIKVACATIQQVNLRVFNDPSTDEKGGIILRAVLEQTGAILNEQELAPSDIPADGYINLPISLPGNAVDQRLTIQVENQTTQSTVYLAYNPQAEYPPDMFYNGKEMVGDLYFTYQCK